MVANSRQLRRCGKKLPRYCDINGDRKISMTEWLNCLNATRPTSTGSSLFILQEFEVVEAFLFHLFIFLNKFSYQ